MTTADTSNTLRLIGASVLVLPVGAVMLAATAVAQLFTVLALGFGWLGGRAQRFLEVLLQELGIRRGR